MRYLGPNQADLANILTLNRAFIAWQRSKPRDNAAENGLSAPNGERLAALSFEQRERLARAPFLLMSLAEGDEIRWQPLFAERQTRDLLHRGQPADETASRLIAAGLGFVWHLSQHNPHAVRLLTGASLAWCEQLAACTLMDLFAQTLDDQTLLAPRMAGNLDLWGRLLTAGVSNRRQLRRATRVAALQILLTQSPARPYRALAAAACKMPPARTRTSGKPDH
jgi:hypothetical protein